MDREIDRLRALRAAGGLVTEDVRLAAGRVGRSERTVWRWLREGAPGSRASHGVGEEDLVEVALHRGNCAGAWRSLRDQGREVPSLRTFQRSVAASFTPSDRALITGGAKQRSRHEIFLAWAPPHRNAVWHTDHKQLPLKVLPPRGTSLLRPWLTSYLDGFSRRVMGWAISLRPTGADVLAALGSAMSTSGGEPGGAPDLVVVDGGLELVGRALQQAAAAFGFEVRVAPPYTPEFNGKIERFHGTIERELLATLVGYEGGPRRRDGKLYGPAMEPLTVRQVVDAVHGWVVWYNDERHHQGVDSTPTESWRQDPTPIRAVSPSQMRDRLLIRESRIVRRQGIRFHGRDFIDPALNGLVGVEVSVGSRPHDERSIEVFHDDSWLCTAIPVGLLSEADRDRILARRAQDRRDQGAFMRKVARRAKVRMEPITGPRDPEVINSFTTDEDQASPVRAASTRRHQSNLLGFTSVEAGAVE